MIKSIIVMSCAQCQRWVPKDEFALIQVLGLTEGEFPLQAQAAATLQLRFDDVHENTHRLHFPEGLTAWPELDSVAARHEFLGDHFDDVLLPGIEHARDVVAFARAQLARPEALDLVVHCLGGVSRSVAIGTFLAGELHVPLDRRSRPWEGPPNPRLLRLLAHAWAENPSAA